MMRTIIGIAIACMIVIPIYVYGYATNIGFLDCACKWDKRHLVVWIDNSQQGKYADYVIEAFDAWRTKFPQLEYAIHTDYTEKWDIRIKIVDRYIDKQIGVLAKTDIIANWSSGSLERVSITMSTHTAEYESKQVEFDKMNDVMFYNVILHEIGHAIGLGHANENEEGMIDPMFKYIDKDEERRTVSKLDVMTLERLYRQ